MPLPKTKTPPKTFLETLTILIYAMPKLGKSTLAAQFPNTLFLATEAGLNHLEVFQEPILSWEQFCTTLAEVARGDHQFRTIAVDTVDNLFQLCREYVLKKLGIEHESDLGYAKGFHAVSGEWHRVLTKLSMLPYGIIFISHATEKEFETRTGKLTRVVPTLPNKAREVLLNIVDIIMYGDFETQAKAPKGSVPPPPKRVLRTKPTMYYEAGDRTRRLPDTIDFDYQALVDAWEKGAKTAPAPNAPDASDPIAQAHQFTRQMEKAEEKRAEAVASTSTKEVAAKPSTSTSTSTKTKDKDEPAELNGAGTSTTSAEVPANA